MYNEIFKLKRMLDSARIPYVYTDRSIKNAYSNGTDFIQHQIEYPCSETENADRVISVIQSFGTYGNEKDLLEIMGLLTVEDRQYESVCGGLSADNVFERIDKHWREHNNSRG